MSLSITFQTLPTWPHAATAARPRFAYKASYQTIITDLVSELSALDPHDVILQMALPLKSIRRDGWPVTDARPMHPGVILIVYTDDGPLELACDENGPWQHNLRAISLTLEALRAVERHGATKKRQQYAGYLAAPVATSTERAEAAAAIAFLAGAGSQVVSEILDDPQMREAYYREAVKRVHPDTGGDAEAFRKLQAAREALS